MRTHKRWLTVGAVLVALLLVSVIPVGANPGIIYVDPLGQVPPCGSAPGVWACDTITNALTMALDGDTIQVADGTYTEDFVVNIPNLTIVSSGGAATTIIQGAVDAQADADGLTFGQPGQGFTLLSGGAQLFKVTNGPANVTIDSNIFDMTVTASSGVWVDGGPTTDGLSVINNTFDQALLAYVGVNIWKPVTNLLVDGNDFNGTAGADNWLSAVTFKNSTVDGAVISDNTIDSASIAMAMGPDGTSMTDITISGNTFSDIVREEGGVIIVEEVEGTTQRVSNIAITGNTFQPSAYDSFAFVISDRDAGVEDTDLDYDTISFTCNNVLDPKIGANTHPIVANLANDALPAGIPALNAESNWWGSKSGPMHASNSYKEPGGDAAFVDVSNDVDFLPWLDAPCPAGSDFAPVALDGVWAYSSIQGAIDDATASTIETRAGTFTESVLVDKSVDILGAGRGVTKLEGGTYGFKVISDTVTIDGFHIDANGTTGVWGLEVSGLTVSNNEVDAWTAFGMLFEDTKGNLDISGNLVHGNSTGIKLDGDAGPSQIVDNEIYENPVDTGIVILDSEGALVQDNYIHHNDTGVYINDSAVQVLRNTILDNTGGATGVLVEGDSGDTELHGNFLEDNGVDVSGQLPGLSQYLDATCNWWGGGPPSTGEVEGLVDYDPWIGLSVGADPLRARANGRDFTTITGSLVCDGYAVPDDTMVDFATDLGWFTLTTTLQEVEEDVPTVDGVASVRLYSYYAGYATITAWIGEVETPDEYVEEDRLVTFLPRRVSINNPPHRSTIRTRRPTVRWTASPSEVPTLVYQLRVIRLRPRPRKRLFDVVTDQTSYRTPYLRGRVFVVRVRACLDDSLTACSKWRRSRFKIAR